MLSAAAGVCRFGSCSKFCRSLVATRGVATTSSVHAKSGAVTKTTESKVPVAPRPNETANGQLQFDQITHTGQAWDQEDYRLQRFDVSKKQVNPNVAMHLIAEQPAIPCKDSVVWCDGGHPALGHPRVYINLDKPGTHACGYCGLRYFNTHVKGDGSNHINC